MGGKTRGSIYIRGVKGQNNSAFKFVLEKETDFADLDTDLIVGALEEVIKMQPPEPQQKP
jgi:hypothetical protein